MRIGGYLGDSLGLFRGVPVEIRGSKSTLFLGKPTPRACLRLAQYVVN